MDRKPDAHSTVSRKGLLNAVSFAKKFSDKNITVLDNVMLSMDGDVVEVRATDLDVEVVTSLDGVGKHAVELLIDKKKLAETLKSLKDESVSLEYFMGEDVPNVCPECGTADFAVVQEDEVLTPSPVPGEDVDWDEVKCAQCEHTGKLVEFKPPNIPPELKIGEFFSLLPDMDIGEFPSPGEFPENMEPVITTTAGSIRKVVGATTKNDSGFQLAAVKFDAGLMVATDGHRLHTQKYEGVHTVCLPSNALNKVVAGKKDDDEMEFMQVHATPPLVIPENAKKADLVKLWKMHTDITLPNSMTIAQMRETMTIPAQEFPNVYMTDGNRKITIRTASDNFPDYHAVTNREEKERKEIVVNVGVLREGMKQALALTNTKYMAVKMSFNGGIDLETVVEGDSYNRTSVAVESGSIDPMIEHNYNAKYISDLLDLFKRDVDLTLDVPEAKTPLFFNDGEGFEGLVMPTRMD